MNKRLFKKIETIGFSVLMFMPLIIILISTIQCAKFNVKVNIYDSALQACQDCWEGFISSFQMTEDYLGGYCIPVIYYAIENVLEGLEISNSLYYSFIFSYMITIDIIWLLFEIIQWLSLKVRSYLGGGLNA